MNLRIEVRYGVLVSLLMLLWLTLEFAAGLHGKFIQYHPVVTMFALVIPVVCGYLAVKEKRNQLGGSITFRQAFIAGFLVAVFAACFAIPFQLAFHKLINPDFFQSMIAYSLQRAASLGMDAAKARAEAEMYFNLSSYLMQAFLGSLLFGTIIALVVAWRLRTVTNSH